MAHSFYSLTQQRQSPLEEEEEDRQKDRKRRKHGKILREEIISGWKVKRRMEAEKGDYAKKQKQKTGHKKQKSAVDNRRWIKQIS